MCWLMEACETPVVTSGGIPSGVAWWYSQWRSMVRFPVAACGGPVAAHPATCESLCDMSPNYFKIEPKLF